MASNAVCERTPEVHILRSLEDEDGVPTCVNAIGSQYSISHVRFDRGSAVPPLPSLTGRDTQRFDGKRRLVGGCVAFRVDRVPASVDHNVDTSSAAPPTSVRLSVLLVHAAKKGDWIYPKGGWEQFESSEECARRECLEEGGVEGEIVCSLPNIEFESKKGKQSRLSPYLLFTHTVHQHWAEEDRARRWVPLDKVDGMMQRAETQILWKHAKETLREHGWIDQNGKPVWKIFKRTDKENSTSTSPASK